MRSPRRGRLRQPYLRGAAIMNGHLEAFICLAGSYRHSQLGYRAPSHDSFIPTTAAASCQGWNLKTSSNRSWNPAGFENSRADCQSSPAGTSNFSYLLPRRWKRRAIFSRPAGAGLRHRGNPLSRTEIHYAEIHYNSSPCHTDTRACLSTPYFQRKIESF